MTFIQKKQQNILINPDEVTKKERRIIKEIYFSIIYGCIEQKTLKELFDNEFQLCSTYDWKR